MLHAPQIILIVIMAIGLASKLRDAKDGVDVFSSVLAVAVLAGLLWWGGFWK